MTTTQPTSQQIRRWRQYLANERAEAALYRELAHRKDGEEREILLAIADAEARHEQHWRNLLGDYVGMPKSPDFPLECWHFWRGTFGRSLPSH